MLLITLAVKLNYFSILSRLLGVVFAETFNDRTLVDERKAIAL
ncbi:MAG: hypothetical protein ACYTXC_25690 [Nostoc sp.]